MGLEPMFQAYKACLLTNYNTRPVGFEPRSTGQGIETVPVCHGCGVLTVLENSHMKKVV